jgi:hypothetical protein
MTSDPKALVAECLRAYPNRPARDPARLGDAFWHRAASGGVAVAIAEQLGVRSAYLDALRRSQTVATMRSQGVTQRLLALCGEMQIRAVPLKGAYLADRLYADAALRPTGDVDLLVTPSAAVRLVERLAAEGAEIPPTHVHAFYTQHHHHLTAVWLHVLVELHFRATSSFGVFMESEPLLERAKSVVVGERNVLVLDPIDELIYLATHAAAHYCAHDILLLDLKLFVARYAIDWPEVERRARALRLDRAVGCAIVASEERSGLDVSRMSGDWRDASRAVLRSVPPDLPPGWVDDWRVRARAQLAHARLCDTKALAIASFARDAVRALKRRAHAALPSVLPANWEV